MFGFKNNEKAFTCIIKKQIFHDENRTDELEHDFSVLQVRLELPFPPYIGLEVTDLLIDKIPACHRLAKNVEIDRELYSGIIQKVIWNGGNEIFECFVKKQSLTKNNDIGAVLFHHLRAGWDYVMAANEDEKKLVVQYIKESGK